VGVLSKRKRILHCNDPSILKLKLKLKLNTQTQTPTNCFKPNINMMFVFEKFEVNGKAKKPGNSISLFWQQDRIIPQNMNSIGNENSLYIRVNFYRYFLINFMMFQ
jgi:hypothetical protein